MPDFRVHIAGWGLVSPLGLSAWETFGRLLAGRTLADRAAALPEDVDPVSLVRALGCVVVAQHTATDPSVEIADRAAREAIFMAGAAPPSEPLPCILAVSKGAVHALTHAARRFTDPSATPQPADAWRDIPAPDAHLAVALGPVGYLAHHLQQRLPIRVLTTTVAACASSLTALHQARLRLLEPRDRQPHDRIVVLTAEAALLPHFIHSYQRLGVLPPLTPQGYRGRPLDQRRGGFMLAELAAAVVLERVADDAPRRPGTIELKDTAIACEAFDLVRTPERMAALDHIAGRLLRSRPIHTLHPHATGTREHDPAELDVLLRHVAPSAAPPRLYASKGALGHGLGAAGLVSLVMACLAARTRRLPPMPWLDNPITPLALNPAAAPASPPAPQTHAIFAAGFAGHVAGAVIEG